MCSVRDLFRGSVSKSLVNGFGTSVECVNGRTDRKLVGSGVLSCWLQVSCKCTEFKCMRVPFVESKQQTQRLVHIHAHVHKYTHTHTHAHTHTQTHTHTHIHTYKKRMCQTRPNLRKKERNLSYVKVATQPAHRNYYSYVCQIRYSHSYRTAPPAAKP